MADCIDKLRSAMLECQAVLDGTKNREVKLDPRIEAKLDMKRRLAAFESENIGVNSSCLETQDIR